MHLKDETLLLWVIRGRVRNLMERISTLVPTLESLQSAAGCVGATLGPSSHLNRGLHPGTAPHPTTPSSPADEYGCDRQNQLGGGKEVKRGRQKPGETLLAGPAWLRPHDFASSSPNISFHGNPEKEGAFILASGVHTL